MQEYPEWFEFLIAQFCMIYPVMLADKAHAGMWEMKKGLWFKVCL